MSIEILKCIKLLPLFFCILGGYIQAATFPRYGGSLLIETNPVNLEPSNVTNWEDWLLSRQIFEPLFINLQTGLKPLLVEDYDWKPNSGKLELRLDGHVFFHDGSPLTPGDVIASWNRLLNSDSCWKGLLRPLILDSQNTNKLPVSIVDNRLIIKLNRKSLSLLDRLSYVPTAIFKYSKINNEFSGTGPFKIDKKSKGYTVLEFTNKYRFGRPYLDRILFGKAETEGTEKRIAFSQQNSQNLTVFFPAKGPERLTFTRCRTLILAFHPRLQEPQFDQLREGFTALLDLPSLLPILANRNAEIAKSLFQNEVLKDNNFTSNEKRSVSDIRQMLKLWQNQRFKLALEKTDPNARLISERLQANSIQNGLQLKLTEYDTVDLKNWIEEGKFDLILLNWEHLIQKPLLEMSVFLTLPLFNQNNDFVKSLWKLIDSADANNTNIENILYIIEKRFQEANIIQPLLREKLLYEVNPIVIDWPSVDIIPRLDGCWLWH